MFARSRRALLPEPVGSHYTVVSARQGIGSVRGEQDIRNVYAAPPLACARGAHRYRCAVPRPCHCSRIRIDQPYSLADFLIRLFVHDAHFSERAGRQRYLTPARPPSPILFANCGSRRPLRSGGAGEVGGAGRGRRGTGGRQTDRRIPQQCHGAALTIVGHYARA